MDHIMKSRKIGMAARGGLIRLNSLVTLGLFLCLITAPMVAQLTSGSIAGTVKDSTGAEVPNATVTLSNTDQNVTIRTLKTDGGGNFSAPLLPVGHYALKVEAPGFKTYLQTAIVLNASDKLTVNPILAIGAASQEVEVKASAVQVETQSAQAAGLVNGTQVRELAMSARNWEQLVTLVPGVSDAGNSDKLYVGAFAPQGTNLVTFSMDGGRREENNFMVDGADNMDRGSNLTLLSFPSVDAIAEFRVVRGQYDPEYGRAASGQVNVITASGKNEVHGDVYEFLQNDAFNARPFASKYPVVTPHIPYVRYNDFGGTIGGPVWIPKLYEQKNKTFFFFSEEVRRNLTYTNGSADVPTSGMLAGNFAHPVCVSFAANNSCTGTASSIPVSSFDPVAQAYIKDIFSKYPTPNATAGGDPFAFTSTLRNVYNFHEELIKIDHNFSQKVLLSGKIQRDTIPTQEAGGLFTSGPPLQGIGTTSTNSPGNNYVLHATIALSPTFLIEPGYAYSSGAILSDPIGLATASKSPDIAAAVKLPYAVTLANRIPNVTLTGGNGPGTYGPYRDYDRNHTAFGNVTKVRGTHTIKFGAIYYHYNKQENAGSGNAGTYAFNNNGLPSGTLSFEQAWANFLLGRIGTFSQASFDLTANIMDNQFEYYAQDSWRVKPNLTVTYGFRHSLFRQPTDADGHLGQFDPAYYNPAAAPCVLANGNLDISLNSSGQVVSGCNPNYNPLNGYIFTNPPPGGTQSPYGSKVGKEFNRGIAPRFGIAWDPWGDGKTSIRAGYGMFYDNGIIFGNAENDIFNGTGFLTSLSVLNTTTANPTGGTLKFSPAPAQLQSRIPIDYKYPYTQQWSLDIQRQIGTGWLADIGYYGNNGIHLPGFYDNNQPAPNSWLNCTGANNCYSGPNAINFTHTAKVNGIPTVVTQVDTSNTSLLNALRPYIGYAGGNAVLNMYTSNYNSLQSQLQKSFNDGSLINVSYTWSHGLTTYQADRTIGSIMPVQGDLRNNYGPTVGDRRHVFTANFVWSIPWLRQQRGFTGHVLGGWEVSGIQTFQTGLPATVAANGTIDPTGADCLGPSPCSLRANQVGDPSVGAQNSYTSWFNPAAFTELSPTQGTIPTERPGAVRLPGFWRTDLAMFKNIKFTERLTGQFRTETFNTFNHLNPICCGSFATSSSSYDKVVSARDSRTMQFALKLLF